MDRTLACEAGNLGSTPNEDTCGGTRNSRDADFLF
jgi:hypothetical protein